MSRTAGSTGAGRARRVVIAAGGTGGHLFPALATAEHLAGAGWEVRLFCDKRAAAYLAQSGSALPCRVLAAASPRGGALRALAAVFLLALGLAQALFAFALARPAAVAAFGGYAAVPSGLAARLLGVPLLVHEQNRSAGLANRWLARRADCIAVSFADTKGLPPGSESRRRHVGTPVRASIAALAGLPYPEPESSGALRLLVFGGSQGAAFLDRLLPEALAQLAPDLRARLRLTQQVRGGDGALQELAARYRDLGVEADLQPFFADMDARLAAAHLVVARAGASTVAELSAVARPALLVPYPGAVGGHQLENARALAASGGAQVLEQEGLTAEAFASALAGWLSNPSRLASAALALRDANPIAPAHATGSAGSARTTGPAGSVGAAERSDPLALLEEALEEALASRAHGARGSRSTRRPRNGGGATGAGRRQGIAL